MAVTQLDRTIAKRVSELIFTINDNYTKQNQGKKLTQTAFADEIGMLSNQLSRIIKGERAFSIDAILDISSKFHVSLDWLIKGEMPMFINEKSGTNEAPDQSLLTQMKTEMDAMQKSLDNMFVSYGKLSSKPLPSLLQRKAADDIEMEIVQGRKPRIDMP